MRAALVPLGRHESVLVLTAHHIVLDLESLRIMGRELTEMVLKAQDLWDALVAEWTPARAEP